MDQDQFKALLEESNKGRYTILCETDNIFPEHIDQGAKIRGYVFPGSCFDGMVAIYFLCMRRIIFIEFDALTPIKKTRFMPELQKEVDGLLTKLTQIRAEHLKLIGELREKAPLLAEALNALIEGMNRLQTMEEDIYNASVYLLQRCERIVGKSSYLEQLKENLDRYRDYTRNREERLQRIREVQDTITRYTQQCEQCKEISFEKIDKISEVILRTCEERNLDIEKMKEVSQIQIVVTSMFIALQEREFFTLDEIVELVKRTRPELRTFLPGEIIREGVISGVQKAIKNDTEDLPTGFIEQTVMGLYTLTDAGKTFAYTILRAMT